MGFIENEKNLITLALISIIIVGIFSYNLYINSNYDIDGNNLGCFDTIRNMFGMLPIIGSGIEQAVDVVTDMIDTTKDVVEKEVEKVTKTVKKIIKKKEVYNIDSNDFTYEEAPYVCQALDSKLATYDHIGVIMDGLPIKWLYIPLKKKFGTNYKKAQKVQKMFVVNQE